MDEPTPAPAAAPVVIWPVKCPSCGSSYNGETKELVTDTQLPEKISQLENELRVLREANERLTGELAVATGRIAELSAAPPAPQPEPRKKERQFIVGTR